jgi:hypothetical protein
MIDGVARSTDNKLAPALENPGMCKIRVLGDRSPGHRERASASATRRLGPERGAPAP